MLEHLVDSPHYVREIDYRYRQRLATTYQRQPNQQGSAVKITGFTSDQRAEEIQLPDG